MHQILRSPYSTYVLIILVTLLGAILRLYGLTVHSLWLDELQSLVTCNPENSFASINEICDTSYDPAPRTFYYLLNLWLKLTGYSDLSARLFPALFGIAAIPLMYFLGKNLLNRQAGIFAAVLTAVNYYNIFYSLEVRFYSLLFFFSALSYLSFFRLLNYENKRNAAGYAVSTLFLIALHYFALLILLTQFLSWLIIKKDDTVKQKLRGSTIYAFLMIVLGFIPFLPHLLKTLSWSGAGQAFDGDQFFMVTYFNLYFGTNGVVVLTALTCFVIFLFHAVDRNLPIDNQSKLRTSFLILSWIIFPLLVAYARTLYSSSAIADRYAIVILPALLLAVAGGAAFIKDRLLKAGIIALFVLGSCIKILPSAHFYSRNSKDDFKGVAQKIKSSTDSVSSFSVYSDRNWHLRYYFNQFGIDPDFVDVAGITDGRFKTGESKTVEALKSDSAIKDLWVASVNPANLQKMKHISSQLQNSTSFIRIDSFAGENAFADHFLRTGWTAGISAYEKLNGISLIPGRITLHENQILDENNKKIAVIWDGAMQSHPINLKKGNYQLILNCRGTVARDTFPEIVISVNGESIARCNCVKEYSVKSFPFNVTRDTSVTIKLNFLNDLYVKESEEDRNVFIKKLVIK